MKSIVLKSPAKLNLLLKVINKRPDGYHNLITLFERIGLFDDIRLTSNPTGKIRVFCRHPQIPKGPKNLTYAVAQLLKNDFCISQGVDIKITKRIPVAAGLAGGSSNAASVLLGLNKIWNLSLTHRQLIGYAKRIGSDVPFFLEDCSWALGTQRGDRIKKLHISTKLWHILIIPRIKVYSREVFGAFRLNQKRPKKASRPGLAVSTLSTFRDTTEGTKMLTKINGNVNMLTRALQNNDIPTVSSLLSNDLETTIVQFHPNLLKAKEKIKSLNTRGAVFSGSGPSLFSLTESKLEAQKFRKILKKFYSQVFVVRTF